MVKSRSQASTWLRGDSLIQTAPRRCEVIPPYHITRPDSPPLLDRGLAKPPVPEPPRDPPHAAWPGPPRESGPTLKRY